MIKILFCIVIYGFVINRNKRVCEMVSLDVVLIYTHENIEGCLEILNEFITLYCQFLDDIHHLPHLL